MQGIFGNGKAPLRLPALAAFAVFAALAGLWSMPPLDRDESRFAQASAQMLESGDFITIRFQEGERNKKPAGIHWLQAASVAMFSDVEAREIWGYRLPSVLGVVLAVLFTYLAARRLYDRRTAFLSGLLLASAPVVAAEATIAKTDGFLLATIALAQLAFVEIYARVNEGRRTGWRWPLLFWFSQGAGILIKGPITPMVSALTGLGLATARKPRLNWIAPLRPLTGAVILLLIAAPWAIAIGLATDGRFYQGSVGVDMLGKLGEAQEGHSGPPGYHALLVWILFWPAAALIAPGLTRLWRERNEWRARFLLAWIVPGWIVFEITATKLPHYVLPFYPALAIAAAHAAAAGSASTRLLKAGAVVYGAAGLAAAAGVVAAPAFLSEGETPAALFAASGAIAAACLFIAGLFWSGRAFAGGVAAAALAALFAWVMLSVVLPNLSTVAISPRISAALEDADRHPVKDGAAPVALAGYHEPSAVFLLGTGTRLVDGAGAARALAAGTVSAAVVDIREENAFRAALNGTAPSPVRLAVIDGLNYSNGRNVSLTIYVRGGED